MARVIMLYHLPVDSLNTLLNGGLRKGQSFECGGETLTVSFIPKPQPGAKVVTMGLAVSNVPLS
jgi:hypothetical protein